MALADLLEKTQKNYVSNQKLGTSKSITYNHKESTLVETTFAFVDTGDYNSKDKEKTANEIKFSNVALTEEPSKLDSITYDGLTWNVREWSKDLGMYIIMCDNQKRNKVSSRSFA